MQFDADGSFKLLSNIVSSQVKIHAPFGGVVPMLAKQEHQKNLVPILKHSLVETDLLKIRKSKGKNQNDNTKDIILKEILAREETLLKKLLPLLKKYKKPDIDLIAVTNGPGLEPALWVGVNFAKALAYYWNLPIIPVNHVEAHIIANWLPDATRLVTSTKLPYPIICLVVSGGHTQLILMRDVGVYKILGETRDDAAGEAFDKLAKMLNLGYPGGPIVAKIANQFKIGTLKFKILKFPRPMINSGDFDFSFSGLKTAALYFVKTLSSSQLKKLTPAICAEFQQAVIDVLAQKTIRAAKEFNVKTILLSGGVAANDFLRETLSLATNHLSLDFSVPPKNFCTDNAAMIALTAYLKTKKIKINSWKQIKVDANLRIT